MATPPPRPPPKNANSKTDSRAFATILVVIVVVLAVLLFFFVHWQLTTPLAKEGAAYPDATYAPGRAIVFAGAATNLRQ